MSRTRFLLSLLALSVALAVGSDYAAAHEYGPITGHTQTLGHFKGPDGGMDEARSNGRGGGYVEERGGYARTAGCVEVACNTTGDGGVLALAVETDYELKTTTNSPVRLSNGASCVAFTSGTGVGAIVNEGVSRYWRSPAGVGPDGGVAKHECCALTAHSAAAPVIVQACPR